LSIIWNWLPCQIKQNKQQPSRVLVIVRSQFPLAYIGCASESLLEHNLELFALSNKTNKSRAEWWSEHSFRWALLIVGAGHSGLFFPIVK
jgi:hypothetical protein